MVLVRPTWSRPGSKRDPKISRDAKIRFQQLEDQLQMQILKNKRQEQKQIDESGIRTHAYY